LRQSNPSILTVDGLSPKLILTNPALPEAEDGENKPDGDEVVIDGSCFSPNRTSWTTGFAARTGGDPQKNGGDEATWFENSFP